MRRAGVRRNVVVKRRETGPGRRQHCKEGYDGVRGYDALSRTARWPAVGDMTTAAAAPKGCQTDALAARPNPPAVN